MNDTAYTVTKTWQNFPAAHRQHNHRGHCRLIHGHNWRFDVTFAADRLDENGFVVDVGHLGFFRGFFEQRFDHTLLLNSNDPELATLRKFLSGIAVTNEEAEDKTAFAKVVVVPNCGMEGLAHWVAGQLTELIATKFPLECHRGLRIVAVTVWEDSKNRATYTVPVGAYGAQGPQAAQGCYAGTQGTQCSSAGPQGFKDPQPLPKEWSK